MYEVPKKGNERKEVGEYLYLAHNTSFNYWSCGELECSYSPVGFVEAEYTPYGKYSVNIDKNNVSIRKDLKGYDLIFGGSTNKHRFHHHFDEVGVRKKAYKSTKERNTGDYKPYNEGYREDDIFVLETPHGKPRIRRTHRRHHPNK